MTNEIKSVANAIEIVTDEAYLREIYNKRDEEALDPAYPFPFGIWFRGQPCKDYLLIPSVFRDLERERNKPAKHYDEEMLINHFKLRYPDTEKKSINLPTFDILFLMQHHELPTRIFDWTESILVALYFAVRDQENPQENDRDGEVFALNVRRLNAITRISDPESRTVCAATSYDTVVRSELARARRRKDLRYALSHNSSLKVIETMAEEESHARAWGNHRLCDFRKWLESNDQNEGLKYHTLERILQCPVAVFPNRLNPRMTSQLSMALVYGGKINRDPEKKTRLPESEPDELDLEHINNDRKSYATQNTEPQPFLTSFIVPSSNKENIRKELARIGIHEAALFPDLDHIGNYLKQHWTFTRK